MSLDVSLYTGVEKRQCNHCGSEYDHRECVYDGNITHNLGKMADAAGIYEALWRPHRLKPEYNVPEGEHNDEYAFEDSVNCFAREIIEPLAQGLSRLKNEPEYFETFNAENGWGLYKHFVPFVEKYLEACREYPEAMIKVSR